MTQTIYPRSLLSRPADLTILVFFSLHSFFVSCVDCLDLWPQWLVQSNYIPLFTLGGKLREFYLATYQDKFLTEQPGWFVVFTWLELAFHLPVCLWVIWAVWNGSFLSLPLALNPPGFS